MTSTLHRLRRAGQRLGLDVRPFRPEYDGDGRAARFLARHGVDLVIDAGANVGQYGRRLREGGYTGRIVSVEPLAAAFARLRAEAAADPLWTAVHAGLGAAPGELTVHVAGNSVSSSALAMLERHAEAAPESRYVGTETAALHTVDELLRDDPAAAPFLKIDTQGFEGPVLDGAAAGLARLAGVQLELSLVELYDGQALFDDLYHRLTDAGFALWSLEPGFADPDSERLLQLDGFFFRD